MRPSVTIIINRNGLRRVPPSPAQVCVSLGICSAGTPNTLGTYGDTTTLETALGVGPLTENLADRILGAGPGQLGIPLNPSVAGNVSATNTSLVAGTGTLVGSAAPATEVDIKIILGGALGTATFQYRVNMGPWSATQPTVGGGPYSFLVPGTLTTVTFAAQTYTAAAVWSVSSLGVITLVGTGTVTWLTQVSSPLDDYAVIWEIVTTGGLGVGQAQYSIDGGQHFSSPITIPGGGVFAIPGTGVVNTFAGTFTDNDVYSFTCLTAGFSTSDVTAAIVFLRAQPVQWGFVVVHGMGANSTAAASLAATVDTQMTACQANFQFVFGIIECPTNGSPGGSTESDATVAGNFTNFASDRVMVCGGDVLHESGIDDTMIRRNLATPVATRLAAIGPGTDPAEVGDPPTPLPRVHSIYRDERTATFSLDGARFCTLTSFDGLDGYFVTNGNMMAGTGSDFFLVQYRRIVDVACRVAYVRLLSLLSSKIRTDPTPGPSLGTIHPLDRDRVEKDLEHYLDLALVATDDAQSTVAQVSPTEKIIQTGNFPVAIGVEPFGYAKNIVANIGLVSPG